MIRHTDRIVISEATSGLGRALVDAIRDEDIGVPVPLCREYADPSDPESLDRWLASVDPAALIQLPLALETPLLPAETAAERVYRSLRVDAAMQHAVSAVGIERYIRVAQPGCMPPGMPPRVREGDMLAAESRDRWGFDHMALLLGLRRCLAARSATAAACTVVIPAALYGSAGPYGGHDLVARVAAAVVAARESGAAEVRVPGSPAASLDLVHVRDLASACILLLSRGVEHPVIHAGAGAPATLGDVVALIRRALAPSLPVVFENGHETGAAVLDPGLLLGLGWTPRVALADGVAEVCSGVAAAASVRTAGRTAPHESRDGADSRELALASPMQERH